MKIFVAHSSNYDYKKELYLPIRHAESLKKHDIFLPKEKEEVITKDIIKNLDVLIAEVSYPSTGEGIELGWADMFGIPIICIYKKDTKPSSAIAKLTNNFLQYAGIEDMIKKIETALRTYEG